jgi:hypothetical protein
LMQIRCGLAENPHTVTREPEAANNARKIDFA